LQQITQFNKKKNLRKQGVQSKPYPFGNGCWILGTIIKGFAICGRKDSLVKKMKKVYFIQAEAF